QPGGVEPELPHPLLLLRGRGAGCGRHQLHRALTVIRPGFTAEPACGHRGGGGLCAWCYATLIELMSRLSSSTVVAPAFSRPNIASSLASRARPAATTSSRVFAAMATMPSASPPSQSPVHTVTSPRATVPPISPGPDLFAPGSEVPRAKTGNSSAAS